MAAEVAERHLARDQEAERHCRHASEQQQQQQHHWRSMVQAERANMNSIEKEALTALLQLPGGGELLGQFLADPQLCGACLTLQDQLVGCGRNCGRHLCQACRSEDNTCSYMSICNQPHPDALRAAIRLLPSESQIVSQWLTAATSAECGTQCVRQGRGQVDQTRLPPI